MKTAIIFSKTNQCTGKDRHVSRIGAAKQARNSVHGVAPYRCYWCGGWHVGHRPGKGRMKRR